MAKVGEHADLPDGSMQQETDRVDGVMRYAECLDGNVAEVKGMSSLKEPEFKVSRLEAGNFFAGVAVAVDGQTKFSGEVFQALDMIRVLMGDEDAVEVFRGAVEGGEALADLTGAESAIDQNARPRGFQIHGVARRTTA